MSFHYIRTNAPAPAPVMKVWYCKHEWFGRMGAYEETACIVIAEIKSKALGMALMAYPNTGPQDWEATEVPTDKELVHHCYNRGT